jgi:hypothetical protein
MVKKLQYGALILEGNWAENQADYLADSRSTARLYTALEDLLSLDGTPIKFIHRPLLTTRFTQDVRDFIKLTEKQNGGTVIILSAHGARIRTPKGKKRRVLDALDGELNLNARIKEVNDVLDKSILVLDSCKVGKNLKIFQKAANALAVIGFNKNVGWVDSTAFILALFDRLDKTDFFSTKTGIRGAARKAISKMWLPPYGDLAEHLGAGKAF